MGQRAIVWHSDVGPSPLSTNCWNLSMSLCFSGHILAAHIKCQDWVDTLHSLPSLSVAILHAIKMSICHVWLVPALLIVFPLYISCLFCFSIATLHHTVKVCIKTSLSHFLEAGDLHHQCLHFLLGDSWEHQVLPNAMRVAATRVVPWTSVQ